MRYRRVLKEIESLMDAKPNTADGDKLDVFSWSIHRISTCRNTCPESFMSAGSYGIFTPS